MYISHSVTPRARVSRDQTAVVQTRQGVISRSSRLGVRHGANTATVLKVACSRLQDSHEQRSWKLFKKKKHVEAGELRRKEVVEVSPFSDTHPPPARSQVSYFCLPCFCDIPTISESLAQASKRSHVTETLYAFWSEETWQWQWWDTVLGCLQLTDTHHFGHNEVGYMQSTESKGSVS